MNDTTTNTAAEDNIDWSDLPKEKKEEMNWKMAHSMLMVAHEMLESKLSRGKTPEPEDYMTPIGIAISCLNDAYPPEELCRMMSALAAVMRIKRAMRGEDEQGEGEEHGKH